MYDFYFEAKKNDKSNLSLDITEEEQEKRKQDYESISSQKEYRDGFKGKWDEAAATYNLTAGSEQFDDLSNYQLGTARMMIDESVSKMSRAAPEFDYEPFTHSDYKLLILYKAAVEHILNQNNFASQIRPFMLDNHVFGGSCFFTGLQMPMRKKRVEHVDGTIEETVVRDFRKPKVVIRQMSLYNTYRNPNVSDFSDVPTGGFTEDLTHNQFVQKYHLPKVKGKNKYKNIEQIPVASHYKVEHYFDEIQDFYRIYVLPKGRNVEGKMEYLESDRELGVPIYDKPISLNRGRTKVNGLIEDFSSGMNLQGQVPLSFSRFIDSYDTGFASQSLYGQGIPKLISGVDGVMQALFNMTVDNIRLQNTVPISFIPNKPGDDLPNGGQPIYSGQFIDGEVRPQPLGTSNMGNNQAMYQWTNDMLRWLTGINHQQFGDDGSRTAFEYGIKVRQNNARALDRLKTMENDCFKRLGMQVLSSALADMTIPEWEELTERQVKEISKQIASKELTAEDYDLKNKRRKRIEYIPVKGYKFKEDFSISKKRSLNYNSTKNSLVEDKSMPGNVSYVPAVEEYLLPDGDIEKIMRYDVVVTTSTMLGDMKAQEMNGIQSFVNMALTLDPVLKRKPIYDNILEQAAELQGLNTTNLYLENEEEGGMLKQSKKLLDEIDNGMVQPQAQMGAGINPGEFATQGGANPQPAQSLQELAAGLI